MRVHWLSPDFGLSYWEGKLSSFFGEGRDCVANYRADHYVIDVAVSPVFIWLSRADDGVMRRFKMLAGMLILRLIAAAHMAALQAHAQVQPRLAQLQALLAALRVRLYAFLDRSNVRALPSHR
jgi:hypothetical protein